MSASSSAVRAGLSVMPCLVVHNCEKAIEFYKRTFGAREVRRVLGPEAKYVVVAELTVGNAPFLVAEATTTNPQTSTMLVLDVDDCETVYRKALDSGAKTVMPPMDKFYGARSGTVMDPFGQRWTISMQKERVSATELAERTRDAMLESATSD